MGRNRSRSPAVAETQERRKSSGAVAETRAAEINLKFLPFSLAFNPGPAILILVVVAKAATGKRTKMYILSAPALSGYEKKFESIMELAAEAARLLDCEQEDVVDVISPDGGTVYCYATQADADADADGAYAIQYTELAAA